MLKRPTKQQVFYGFASLMGLILYWLLTKDIADGSVALVIAGTAYLTMLCFALLVGYLEWPPGARQPRRIFHSEQSWSLMVGPLIMIPMFTMTARIWAERSDTIPSWAHQWWWTLAGLGVLFAFGALQRVVCNGRYRMLGYASVLKSPSRWWFDHWQVPICAAVVVTRVIPTWFAADGLALWTIVLCLYWVGFAVIDHFRDLHPQDQYVEWDEQNFRVAA